MPIFLVIEMGLPMSTQEITGVPTQEFWSRYANKGSVGLVAGTLWIHRAICEAQALITPDRKLASGTMHEE